MMPVKETVQQSIQSLLRNRLRSGLTMLGIAWGLVTVVLLISYGAALGQTILMGFMGIGNNVIMGWGGQTSMQAGGERSGKRIHLTAEDADAVREQMPLIRAFSVENDTSYSFKWNAKAVNIQVKAIELPYDGMRKLVVEQGRYFTADDFSDHRKVCIFGPHAAEKLFNGYPPVGETVQLNGQTFTVIGVLQNKIQDSSNNGPDNENVFIPFFTLRDLENIRDPSSLVYQPLSPELNKKATNAVRSILAARHHFNPNDEKAFSVWDTIENAQEMTQFSLALETLLGIIGAMTLAVGGVGVMNIMLVSVTERTREIGLQKALGARRRDILSQFLLESLTLTFLAGIAGMVAAIVIAHLIPPMPLYSDIYKTAGNEGDIILRPNFTIALVSFAILALVGLISGFLPAWRASRLDPVTALRHEG